MSYLMINYEQAERLAAAMYMGERCRFCGKEYTRLDDMKATVWGGDSWVHATCYRQPPIGRFVVSVSIVLFVLGSIVWWGA